MNKYFRTAILLIFVILGSDSIHSKLQSVLNDIERNNRTLNALRAGNEAMRLDNLTGLNLSDPEIGFSYMWGASKHTDDKINIEVSQSFDFATLSGAKKLALGNNELLKLQYRQAAIEIRLQARQALVNLTYYNALIDVLGQRMHMCDSLFNLFDKALEAGQITVMDMNSIKLRKYNMQNDLRMAEIERNYTQQELDLLNGGQHIEYKDIDLHNDALPTDFSAWYEVASQNNPELQALLAQVNIDIHNINIAKKEGLPNFSIGYVNEISASESLHGVSVGVSVPLWSNSGKVKAAKASQLATQLQYEDAVLKFMVEMQAQYQRTASLEQVAYQYEDMMRTCNNTEYLTKSLSAGKVTMIDYLTETDTYTEMTIKSLDAWREYHLALARLSVYTE